MRMAILVYEFPPKILGGLGTYAAEITKNFTLLGHEVNVYTMNDEKGNLPVWEMWHGIEINRPTHVDISDSLPIMLAEDIKKWGRGVQFFSEVLVYNCLSASKLVQDSVQGKKIFDIVIAHDWLSIIAGAAVKKELGLPLAFHVHSTEIGRTMDNGSSVIRGFEERGCQVADIIITVSNAMRRELIESGYPKEKIRVCYNGIDPQKYSVKSVSEEVVREVRQRYGVNDNEFMALFIGRLVGVKGVDKLIMAMPQILEEIPNLKLVIVGIGNMQMFLETLVEKTNLQDSVKFRFDFIPENLRVAHYAACDVAVFPSIYEPFGIVALEAMSMEKPVVVGATGISGMRETVISDGKNKCGFHVNPNDPKNIAEGIIAVFRDPAQRAQMGQNGRKRAKKEFSWDIATEKTIQLYEELMESKNYR